MAEQYKLKQGDKVVMHTCMEHDHPDNFGKVWMCKTDSFRHKGHDYDSIFLEGYSGSFSTEYLQKVDLSEAQQTISTLKHNADYWGDMALRLADSVELLNKDDSRLRKALEEATNHLHGHDMDERYRRGFIDALKFFGDPFADTETEEEVES